MPASLASFLLGGELSAIALIRFTNWPAVDWARDSFLLTTAADVGRYGWIALTFAAFAWTRTWKELRAIASLDGAGTIQTAWFIVWPLVWPMLLAGAMLVGGLSLSETAATGTLCPQHPPVLTVALLTWIHKRHYEPLVEASLLAVFITTGVGVGAVALGRTIVRRQREFERQRLCGSPSQNTDRVCESGDFC